MRSRYRHRSAASVPRTHWGGSPPAAPPCTAPTARRHTRRRRRRSRSRCRLPAERPRTPRRRPRPSRVARVCPRRALTRRCQLAHRTLRRHMRHLRRRREVADRCVSFLAAAPSGPCKGRQACLGTPLGLCLERVSRRECLNRFRLGGHAALHWFTPPVAVPAPPPQFVILSYCVSPFLFSPRSRACAWQARTARARPPTRESGPHLRGDRPLAFQGGGAL